MGKLSAKMCVPFGAETMDYDPCTAETKTKEAAGLSLSPLYFSMILWRPKVGKNQKTRGFLGYCPPPRTPPSFRPRTHEQIRLRIDPGVRINEASSEIRP